MVVVLQGVLIVALVAGIKALADVDNVAPAGAAPASQSSPDEGSTVRDHFAALTDRLDSTR
jgi:hypothetical protein